MPGTATSSSGRTRRLAGILFQGGLRAVHAGTDAVSGTVKNGSGTAVSGALVALLEDACGTFLLRDFTLSDSGGHYTLHSRAGSHEVFAFPAGGSGLAGTGTAVTIKHDAGDVRSRARRRVACDGHRGGRDEPGPGGGRARDVRTSRGVRHEEAIADPNGAFSVRVASGSWSVDVSRRPATRRTPSCRSRSPSSAPRFPWALSPSSGA